MRNVLIACLFLLSQAVYAACDNLYPHGKQIIVLHTTELCNTFYVSLFDQQLKGVILTSEILTPHTRQISRDSSFRVDTRIPIQNQGTDQDYIRSGFDKGHMVPAADATTEQEMHDTFVFTNVTPQQPTLNRKAWKELEEFVRNQVNASNTKTYVITGAIYPQQPATIGNKLPVPSGYFKVVYFQSGTRAFTALNQPNATVTEISLSSLQRQVNYSLPQ